MADDNPKPKPVWAYKDGEAKLFQSPDDVPSGWTDTPAKEPEKPAKAPARKAAKDAE